MHHTLRLLFPHVDRLAVERHGAEASAAVETPPAALLAGRKLLCVEADGDGALANPTGLLRRVAAGDVTELYWRTPSAEEARAVVKAAAAAAFADVQLYGIDPDYYYSLVPLGEAPIERFVLGLKPGGSGWKARLKQRLKRMLIGLGRTEQLYEGYLVVGVRRAYSDDELRELEA